MTDEAPRFDERPPAFGDAVKIADVVYERVKKELLGDSWLGAFDRGRLFGQEEGKRFEQADQRVPFASFEDLRQRFLDSEATIRDFQVTVRDLRASVSASEEQRARQKATIRAQRAEIDRLRALRRQVLYPDEPF